MPVYHWFCSAVAILSLPADAAPALDATPVYAPFGYSRSLIVSAVGLRLFTTCVRDIAGSAVVSRAAATPPDRQTTTCRLVGLVADFRLFTEPVAFVGSRCYTTTFVHRIFLHRSLTTALFGMRLLHTMRFCLYALLPL